VGGEFPLPPASGWFGTDIRLVQSLSHEKSMEEHGGSADLTASRSNNRLRPWLF